MSIAIFTFVGDAGSALGTSPLTEEEALEHGRNLRDSGASVTSILKNGAPWLEGAELDDALLPPSTAVFLGRE